MQTTECKWTEILRMEHEATSRKQEITRFTMQFIPQNAMKRVMIYVLKKWTFTESKWTGNSSNEMNTK